MQKTGFQMLSDDEIATSVQEYHSVDDETDEEEHNSNESSKGPSNSDVFSALEIAMELYEQQSECCPTQLLLLKRIRPCSVKREVYNGTEKNKRLFSSIKGNVDKQFKFDQRSYKATFTPRQSASSIERLTNQRLHFGRDEVCDWLDAENLGANAA
ncbi:uncharacterized protein TNCV_4009531 [Trichonephila clavipes]|nr:uncharacterized protein TNCV_4009531 [Trichonephila clavipes]